MYEFFSKYNLKKYLSWPFSFVKPFKIESLDINQPNHELTSFLKSFCDKHNDIGIDELTAFMDFNLAPLNLRRDIAMLWLIRRTVIGQGPQHFR